MTLDKRLRETEQSVSAKEKEEGIWGIGKPGEVLEQYVERERMLALGWMYAYACTLLDAGYDLRHQDIRKLAEKAKKALASDGRVTF